MDLFEHLGNLTEKKVPFDLKNDEQSKSYAPYLINRFVSMSESFLLLANEINKYPDLSKESHYNFYLTSLPKRRQYFKYIKKTKEISEEDMKYVAEFFEITNRDAEHYIKILTEEQIKEIVKKYRYGKNDLKKV
jgi:hypothetical protein